MVTATSCTSKNTSHRTHLSYHWKKGGEYEESTRNSWDPQISRGAASTQKTEPKSQSQPPPSFKNSSTESSALYHSAEFSSYTKCRAGVSPKLFKAVEHCPSHDPMISQRNSPLPHRRCKCCAERYSTAWYTTSHRSEALCCPSIAQWRRLPRVHETHRSAECLPERDTLLPTGEGRLLPLCRSSIDLLQGFDLSTELSTVLSTLSKSKLKQKRDPTQDLKVDSHTNTRLCVTGSFWPRICTPCQGGPRK